MKMNCFAGTTTILLLVMAGAGAQQKAPTPPPKAAPWTTARVGIFRPLRLYISSASSRASFRLAL